MSGAYKDGYSIRIWCANAGANAEDPYELCPYSASVPEEAADYEQWMYGWEDADNDLRNELRT